MNPEELVRQYVLQILRTTFGYLDSDIETEFRLRIGASKGRADIAVFYRGTEHIQSNIQIVVECKRSDEPDDSKAYDQLESYLSVCPNAKYGVLATHRWYVVERAVINSLIAFRPVVGLIDAYGIHRRFSYNPPVYYGSSAALQLRNTSSPISPTSPYSQARHMERLAPSQKFALGSYNGPSITSIPAPPTNYAFAPYTRVGSVATQVPPVRKRASVFPKRIGLIQTCLLTLLVCLLLCFGSISLLLRQDYTTLAAPTRPGGSRGQPIIVPTESMPLSAPTATITETATKEPTASPTPALIGSIQARVNVNLRQDPGLSAPILRSIARGSVVEIIGQNLDGSWLQVRLDSGEIGWVASYLVQLQ